MRGLLHCAGVRRLGHVAWAAAVIPALVAPGCVAAPPGSPPTVTESSTMAQSLQAATEGALEDAARRTGLPVERLRVIEAAPVTWPDGSLGCPQDGIGYTQALVRGYRILIQAGETVLHYHAGSSGKPFHCPPERATQPLPGAAT